MVTEGATASDTNYSTSNRYIYHPIHMTPLKQQSLENKGFLTAHSSSAAQLSVHISDSEVIV